MAIPPDMTVAVLAGGLGTRLRPVVGDLPKVLAQIRGRPYLTHLIDWLARFGVSEVLLLAGHGADELQNSLGDSHAGVRIAWSVEPHSLGTAGALGWALPRLSATTLLLNGDSFCDVNLTAFCEHHRALGAEVSLVLAQTDDTSRFGLVETEGDGRVLRFEEKKVSASAGWVNAGIYLLNRSAIDPIPQGRPISLERDVLPELAARGTLFAFRASGQLFDIGTPEGYEEAARLLPTSVC